MLLLHGIYAIQTIVAIMLFAIYVVHNFFAIQPMAPSNVEGYTHTYIHTHTFTYIEFIFL